MKRLLIMTIFAIASINLVAAAGISNENTNKNIETEHLDFTAKHTTERGYRGFFSYTPLSATFINNGIAGNISTTHGYQFNHNHFVGLGTAFHINLGNIGLCIAFPIYCSYKGTVGKKLAQFTYGVRLGVAYTEYGKFGNETSIQDGTIATGYINAHLGLKLAFSPNFALRITPELDVFAGNYNVIVLGAKIGLEF